jgi:predicted NACHT family NTPase
MATASKDQTVKVWDAASGGHQLTLKGHESVVYSVAFSPDGRRILSASFDKTAKVWDAVTGTNLVTLRGHGELLWAAEFSPDGRRIATCSNDRTARVWDGASGEQLLTLSGHASLVVSVAFSPNGQRIATASSDRTAKVWDTASGRELLPLKGHSDQVWSVAFSPDGGRLLTGSYDGTTKVWDTASGKELLTLHGHSGAVRSALFSPDGRQIVTASYDGTAKVWTAATAQQVDGWRREEKAAAERVASLQQELSPADERERALRAREPGAIKQWLVLAPIPLESRNALAALENQQVSQEALLRPRAGEKVRVGAGELAWNPVQLRDSVLDFNELLKGTHEWSVAYAICYIQSDWEQNGLLAKVGSDDEAKLYLNGRQIYQNNVPRACVPDTDVASGVDFRAGLNVVVFKVVNEAAGWQGCLRFTDADGQPVKGIHVTLTPR